MKQDMIVILDLGSHENTGALRTAPALGPPSFMQGILHLTALVSLPVSLNDLPKVLELDVWQKSHAASRNYAS